MVLGFDIGGTKCAVILAEAKKDQIHFLDRYETKTTKDWKGVLDELMDQGERMLKDRNLHEEPFLIGVSCGGPLDAKRGIILSPPNLPGWNQVPVVEVLDDRFKRPAKLQNDADACALAEWKYGAGRGTDHMIFLTFGTGLGAGLILNGKLYRGASNMAGEVGHIRLTEDGPMGYGKKGSFEGYCSGGGIAQIAREKAEKLIRDGKSVSYFHGKLDEISTKDVALAAEEGHEDALDIFRVSGKYFGRGLSILMDILNPEVIVAGSIFTRAGVYLQEEMIKEIEKEALVYSRRVCRVLPSTLGEAIGDYGAVVTALEDM